MVAIPPSTAENCDVFVVGAGLAGASAAIGFARAGFSVISCGAVDRLARGRTVALLGRSVDLLEELGVWGEVEKSASPLRSLRIVDDTGSLLAARPVEFHAREINSEAFGWNIPNARLADILARPLAASANLARVETNVESFDFSGEYAVIGASDGRRFGARLVIGADGRDSSARKAAGIDSRLHRYAQSALTMFLTHTRPHDDFSTEFHTRQGPFTLVPLPGADEAPFRSSLVWVMSEAEARRRAAIDDEALACEIEDRAHGLLGAIRIEPGRGAFPTVRQSAARLTATRLALVGDAGHAFPPIGAQGLNLGLRDVMGLLDAARAARAERADIGGEVALAGYAASRRADIAFRTLAVDGLNRSLLADFASVDALRGLGLTALRHIGPLRRLVMREGVAPGPGAVTGSPLARKTVHRG
jgi:2-octaprenyl-6-methoxyphenol hydroxylase